MHSDQLVDDPPSSAPSTLSFPTSPSSVPASQPPINTNAPTAEPKAIPPQSSPATPHPAHRHSRRRHTHVGHPEWDKHRHSLKMLRDEIGMLGLMHSGPVPPKADTHQAHYEPSHSSIPTTTRSHHHPVTRHRSGRSSGGSHSSHDDLVHSLHILAEQGHHDPSAHQRSWRGMVFKDHHLHSTDTVYEDSRTMHIAKSSPRPIPSLTRSYTEGAVPAHTPSPSPWNKIRQRLGSFSRSLHDDEQKTEPHFAGTGWGGRRSASLSPEQGKSSTAIHHLDPSDARRAMTEVGSPNYAFSPSPYSSPHHKGKSLHRQPSMPITGAPGFNPHRNTFGGHAAAIWAAEELQHGGERQRGIPVSLVGRHVENVTPDEGLTSTDALMIKDGVVSPWLAAHLQAQLPPRLRSGDQWKLIYGLDQHGVSLKTMYSLANKFFGLDIIQSRSDTTSDPFALLDQQLSQDSSQSSNKDAGLSVRNTFALDSRQRSSGRGNEPVVRSTSPESSLGTHTPQAASGSAPRHHLGATMGNCDAGLVLAIRDMQGNVFGAFLNSHIQIQPHYYGSGESFLWKVVPNTDPHSPDDDEASKPERKLICYPWTGRNDMIVLSERRFLSVGFSPQQGQYGLWIDEGFSRGSSARCTTFNNDILCSPTVPTQPAHPGGREEQSFECFQVELWAVGLSS